MSGYVCAGLTGGIASGKSTVSARFRELGAYIADADEISRHALDVGTDCYVQTVQVFGEGILLADGQVNRKKLGDIVFAEEAERQKLNAIVHPYVRRRMDMLSRHWWDSNPRALILWDVPLLFENGLHRLVQKTIVVTASVEQRIARMAMRNGYTREEALARIHSQMPEEEKVKLADYVLDNSGDLPSLYAQVDVVYEKLINELCRS